MATRAAAASGAKRKRPSVPITPSDSPAKRRTRGSAAAAAAAAEPPTLVTVPPPNWAGDDAPAPRCGEGHALQLRKGPWEESYEDGFFCDGCDPQMTRGPTRKERWWCSTCHSEGGYDLCFECEPRPGAGAWALSMRPGRDAGQFIDITLVVGPRKIQAHRNVLAGLSPYIEGLLTSGLSESAQTGHEMTIGDESTDGRSVEAIVDLMYSGRLAMSGSTVGSMIRTANLLQVGAAEKAACDFFVKSLEPCTACDALSFAASFAECGAHARELLARCVGYVVGHFAECSREPEFLGLPSETVAQLIGSDDLPVKEEAVLAALTAWFEHDQAGRKVSLMALVPLIRWPLLPSEIKLKLSQEPLLRLMIRQDDQSCEVGMKLLLECTADFAASDDAASCPRLKHRKGGKGASLAFTQMDETVYSTSEDGAMLTTTDGSIPRWKAAKCGDHVMNRGKSCAEFTIVKHDGDGDGPLGEILIGLARPTLLVTNTACFRSSSFWGLITRDGEFYGNSDESHSEGATYWEGQEGFEEGDVVRLLLNSDAGTLTVKKNGRLLGVAVTEGLTGDLVWAVSCGDEDFPDKRSVRIEAVNPADF